MSKLLKSPAMFKTVKKAHKKAAKINSFNLIGKTVIEKSFKKQVHHATNIFSFGKFFDKFTWG